MTAQVSDHARRGVVAAGRRLPDLPAQLRRLERRRHRRPAPASPARCRYLRELGVDAVWLSPFYPSALADGGYDVDDYRDVDPRIGTLERLRRARAALHAAGIRLIVDIVPNHTSNRHVWFQEALASPPGSPARERYIFRRGRGEHGELPPSDWTSTFGGPAWEPVGDGEWYLHLFAPEQPDLNWANDEVRQEFLTTLRFWADRGVDGFRIDVAHALAKDLTEPLREPGGPRGRHLGRRAPARRTATRCTTSTASGAGCSTSTTRRARRSPRPGSPRTDARATPRPTGWARRSTSTCSRRGWDAEEFAAVIDTQPRAAPASPGRRPPGCCPTTTWCGTPPGTRCPSGTDLDAWLLRDGTRPAAGRGARPAPRACSHPADAGPARLGLPLPGRGAGPARGGRPARRGRSRTRSWLRTGGAQKGRDGCRVPLPWATDGPVVRLRRRRAHLPVPARSSAASPSSARRADDALDPELLPTGARRAAPPADRGDAGRGCTPTHAEVVAFRDPAAGRPSRTSAARRCRCRRRHGARVELSGGGARSAPGDDRLAAAGPRADA